MPNAQQTAFDTGLEMYVEGMEGLATARQPRPLGLSFPVIWYQYRQFVFKAYTAVSTGVWPAALQGVFAGANTLAYELHYKGGVALYSSVVDIWLRKAARCRLRIGMSASHVGGLHAIPPEKNDETQARRFNEGLEFALQYLREAKPRLRRETLATEITSTNAAMLLTPWGQETDHANVERRLGLEVAFAVIERQLPPDARRFHQSTSTRLEFWAEEIEPYRIDLVPADSAGERSES